MFWKEESELLGISKELEDAFSQLRGSVDVLVDSRMDINRQYPAMALSANDMTVPQNAIRGNLQILIDEIDSGELEPRSEELHTLLLKAQFLWLQHIAQLRIYLANRFASFSTDLLVEQATSLREINDNFNEELERIATIYATEESFEGPAISEAIKEDSELWMAYFQKVSEISESEQWRTDSHLMETVLIPQIDEITVDISRLEDALNNKEHEVVEKLQQNADTLTTLLFIIILLFLFFISTILLSLNWMVFKPISNVAAALKSKAFDVESPQLLSASSKEVNLLIDAFREMDEQVEQRQKALEHQALHDHLTGLPNRFMLTQRLDYQLLTSEREQRRFTLMLMDLDNFKDVNDSLGHSAGDMLLIEMAKRLTERMRKADTVARLGGDEFAFLLPDTDKQEAEQLVKGLHDSVTTPMHVDGHIINVGVSVGIVSYPDDGTDSASLLRHADMAMYVAKRNRTVYSEYDAKEDFYTTNRLILANDLRQALAEDGLELYYQPQVNLYDGSVIGAEALLRWNHPKFGFIRPDKIVELAEYLGIIHKLSLWVLSQAISQGSAWHEQGEMLRVSVNLSVHDLNNPQLCDEIAAMLERHLFSCSYLTLEVTESGMMENPARSIEVLQVLNDMGITLSIDDFGTGFSSLAYLKRLPVHELKIDKSFVLDMDKDESDAVIVQSTINLGHNLGLSVIAEGIENQTLFETVREFGCDQAQGYLLSKPQVAEEFLQWVRARNSQSLQSEGAVS